MSFRSSNTTSEGTESARQSVHERLGSRETDIRSHLTFPAEIAARPELSQPGTKTTSTSMRGRSEVPSAEHKGKAVMVPTSSPFQNWILKEHVPTVKIPAHITYDEEWNKSKSQSRSGAGKLRGPPPKISAQRKGKAKASEPFFSPEPKKEKYIPHQGKYDSYTPLTLPRAKIYSTTKDEGRFKKPRQLPPWHQQRGKDQWCEFHDSPRHRTEDCVQLKDQIEDVVRKGYLKKYLADRREEKSAEKDPRQNLDFPRKKDKGPNDKDSLDILVISGGTSRGAAKRHMRGLTRHVNHAELRQPQSPMPNILFTAEDCRGVVYPHDDPLVIILGIANRNVWRTLVDGGSGANVLFRGAFDQLKLEAKHLTPAPYPVSGFNGSSTYPDGRITLPVTIGLGRTTRSIMAEFLVVDAPSVYNVIMGRPLIHDVQGVVSTYHQTMVYVSDEGRSEKIKGSQREARRCNHLKPSKVRRDDQDDEEKKHRDRSSKKLKGLETSANENPPREKDRGGQKTDSKSEPKGSDDQQRSEQPADIDSRPEPEVSNSKNLETDSQTESIELAEGNSERCVSIGLDLELETRAALIQLLQASGDVFAFSAIEMPGIDPNLISHKLNVDPTSQPIKQKKRNYSAEKNLNITAEIFMHPEDRAKTAVVTSSGVYNYKMMPFGLKNAGATYQRLVDQVFAEQKGRNMEAYVDDSIVKSIDEKDHFTDLAETFATLRKHNMKLNPKKCVFGVKSGKFLGFMVSKRGIDANLAKVQAALDLPEPRTKRDIQRLTGRMAALSRFISRASDKGLPFFKALKLQSSNNIEWGDEQKLAFQQLRDHLAQLPTLARPVVGETLYLYVAVSPTAVSAVLLKEEEKIQQPIYFVSHTLTDAESRYPLLEKIAYAVVVAARKLRPYFDSHQIVVLTDQPLEKVLGKVEKSGRLTKWAFELTEFSISYQPRAAIKAQALADFLAECSYQETLDERKKIWTVFTDGSSTVNGSGAGVVVTSPKGKNFEYALKFSFRASNNEAEYEAAIAGLDLCISLEAEHVCLKTDSQLVANQIRGEYKAKEPSMIAYLTKIKSTIAKLRTFEVELIPRGQNAQADALSKLASSTLTELNRSVYVEVRREKSVAEAVKVCCAAPEPSWMDPILAYKLRDELPEDRRSNRR
ncbi:uncharacterized protein LOC110698832 [Chenopodium quinoa]|uniref:uncharacterized protein LOC110698832 n=1 Tax=Chenopodium quinoa TaxID=63459 RepID=UPI000B793C17|nr:uncharacterized protein LOC110698832 [Chenopodium quinoa]